MADKPIIINPLLFIQLSTLLNWVEAGESLDPRPRPWEADVPGGFANLDRQSLPLLIGGHQPTLQFVVVDGSA